MLIRWTNKTSLRHGLSGTAALALTAATHAGGFTETQVHDILLPLGSGSAAVSIDRFDDAGGRRILREVRIRVELVMQGRSAAENDSTSLWVDLWTVWLSGFATIDCGGIWGSYFAFNATESSGGPVAPSDGVPGSGPDFFAADLMAGAFEVATLSGIEAAAFVGDGSITAHIFAAGGMALSPMMTDLTWSTAGLGVEGSVSVDYVYRERPPASSDPLNPG